MATSRERRRPRWPRRDAWVLWGWTALIVSVVVWGSFGGAGIGSQVGAPPFMGRWRIGISWRLLPAIGVALLAVRLAPGWFARLRWRQVLAASAALAIVWSLTLSCTDGIQAVTAPLETRYEYLRWVPMVGSPGEFVRTFVDRLPVEATHVKSHPPGMVLVLWVLDRLGLVGSGPAAAMILAAVGASAVAVLVAFRNVAGEAASRRAAPFVVFLPASVWMATSPDAFFLGVSACGVTCVVLSTSRTGARALGWAITGGALLGISLFLSYGMAAVLGLPAAVIFMRRRWDVIAPTLGGILLVAVAFAAAGFWWFDGLAATHERYRAGVGAQRSDAYFLVANLAVLAVAVGPAVVVAVSRVRKDWIFLLSGSALVILLVINASGLSEGEVERIWLPFVPWIATAAAALGPSERDEATGLGLHVATGLAVQVLIRSPW